MANRDYWEATQIIRNEFGYDWENRNTSLFLHLKGKRHLPLLNPLWRQLHEETAASELCKPVTTMLATGASCVGYGTTRKPEKSFTAVGRNGTQRWQSCGMPLIGRKGDEKDEYNRKEHYLQQSASVHQGKRRCIYYPDFPGILCNNE